MNSQDIIYLPSGESLHIDGNAQDVSDGVHSFSELYDHRITLFLALMALQPSLAWFSPPETEDSLSFLAGMKLPTGQISYHIPTSYWNTVLRIGIKQLPSPPPFDGHDSQDVLERITEWALSL